MVNVVKFHMRIVVTSTVYAGSMSDSHRDTRFGTIYSTSKNWKKSNLDRIFSKMAFFAVI